MSKQTKTTTAFNKTMFQSIKDALNKQDKPSNTSYSEIMKLEPGKTYTVRLLPLSKDPEKTFYHYYSHGWNSLATGQYVQAVSPTTNGERDPIAEERYRVRKAGTEDEKAKAEGIRRIEKWLVNVYVVEDPTTPDNVGKVKIVRFGKQLHKIIMAAIEGEDAEEYGERVFDLSDEGVNLRIKVEKQGDFPSYVASTFKSAPKLGLSDEKQQEIYNAAFELDKVFGIKTYQELQTMLDEHFHCKLTPVTPVEKKQPAKQEEAVGDDTVFVSDTDDIDELLKGL